MSALPFYVENAVAERGILADEIAVAQVRATEEQTRALERIASALERLAESSGRADERGN